MTSDSSDNSVVQMIDSENNSVGSSSLSLVTSKNRDGEHRPPALLIPLSITPPITSPSNKDRGTSFKPISESTSSDSMDGTSRSSFLSSNTANLIYVSTRQMNDMSDIRIPLSRTKTPRTPQSMRHHSFSFSETHSPRRRTSSPVDEICLGPVHQSPSQYMMNRYKAFTPKSSDFSI